MDPSPALQPTGGSPIDLSKEFEFRLEFDIEEDIEGELEHFVRLARFGLAKKARDYFQQTLSTHLSLFPVFAEYAEFLVSECGYDELLSILPTSQEDSDFSDAEYHLVRLLKASIDTREQAADLGLVERWCVDQLMDSKGQFDETTIQCLEVCLVILAVVKDKLGRQTWRYYLSLIDRLLYELLGPTGGYLRDSVRGYSGTVALLVKEGRYWEASKIVKLLFESAYEGDAVDVYYVFCKGIKQADDTDENVIVARLSVNNAYLKFWVHHTISLGDWLRREELEDLQRATARDLRQLLRDFRDDGSRHTEEFLDNICEMSRIFESDFPATDRHKPFYRDSLQADRGNQPTRPKSTSPSSRTVVETPGHYGRSRPSKHDEIDPRSLDSELGRGREYGVDSKHGVSGAYGFDTLSGITPRDAATLSKDPISRGKEYPKSTDSLFTESEEDWPPLPITSKHPPQS